MREPGLVHGLRCTWFRFAALLGDSALTLSNPFFDHPILNSPCECPARHWELDPDGQPTQKTQPTRHRAEFITPIPKPKKRKGAAQQTEIAYDEGQGLSTKTQQYDPTPIIKQVRPALKQASGAGKTTVMAMIIAGQTVNAVRRPASKQCTRGFLIVAPGLTVKDRLRVLPPNDPDSCYQDKELVPGDMLEDLNRAKIVITNFHAFRLRDRVELSKGEPRRSGA